MASKTRRIDVIGDVYRVVICSNTPDRDAMAEVAKLIGMQRTPMIMEAQGYDWQTSNGHWVARLSGFPAGGSGSVCGCNHVPAGTADKDGKAG